jgi:hypothetical protein
MELSELIFAITEPKIQQVLYKKYLQKMTWREISADLFYSVSNCKKLHKKGIILLGEMIVKIEESENAEVKNDIQNRL